METLLKQTQALQLRAHGHNYRGIAKALGCSPDTAHRLVTAAIAAERETISQAKADVVELELHRCDTYLQAIAKKVQSGDVRAVDTAMRVAERRARLLGLDASNGQPDDGKPISRVEVAIIDARRA